MSPDIRRRESSDESSDEASKESSKESSSKETSKITPNGWTAFEKLDELNRSRRMCLPGINRTYEELEDIRYQKLLCGRLEDCLWTEDDRCVKIADYVRADKQERCPKLSKEQCANVLNDCRWDPFEPICRPVRPYPSFNGSSLRQYVLGKMKTQKNKRMKIYKINREKETGGSIEHAPTWIQIPYRSLLCMIAVGEDDDVLFFWNGNKGSTNTNWSQMDEWWNMNAPKQTDEIEYEIEDFVFSN